MLIFSKKIFTNYRYGFQRLEKYYVKLFTNSSKFSKRYKIQACYGEFPADGVVHPSDLAVLLQQHAEDREVAVVLLAHILRILAAQRHHVRARHRGCHGSNGG
jgi:hypothetical protein